MEPRRGRNEKPTEKSVSFKVCERRERDNFEPITTVFEVSGNIITLLGGPINRDFFYVFSKKKFLRDNLRI